MASAGDGAAVQEAAPGWRVCWRAFNVWRRKYWLTRVIILLLIFWPATTRLLGIRPMMVKLVRIATEAILMAREPAHAWALAQYNMADEAHRLRALLRTELGADHGGHLGPKGAERAREAGLDPEQLTVPIVDADLEQLAGAVSRLGLAPGADPAARIRQRAWDAARAESRRFFEGHHRRIDNYLANGLVWPDYGRWTTWRRGARLFALHLFGVVGPPRLVATWFAVCLLVPGSAALLLKQRRAAAGAIAGAAMAAVAVTIGCRGIAGWEWAALIGSGLLGGLIGHLGGRLAARTSDRLRWALVAAIVLGGVLLLRGATLGYERKLYFGLLGGNLASGDLQEYLARLPSVEPGILAAGAALVALGGAGLVLRRRARTAHRPEA